MRLLASFAPLILTLPVAAQTASFPGETWMQYASPEEAGFSHELLAEAREYWQSFPSAAYMIVYRGAVVAAWGDVDRRYMCHSVRKSFLSGLIGAHVDAGHIDLDLTLDELGIDDIEDGLTETEKSATIFDLIRARSGVFRLAAYEPPQNPKPQRHAYAPGEHFCYNNWDFNSLCTIFEQLTETKIFEEFERVFAQPLGMQDYRARDGYYHYELEKSEHPAYPFRMSARDMARYGLLYLNEGNWDGQRILSEEWVAASRFRHSELGETRGYGYMWWIDGSAPQCEHGAYSARGVGNQMIQVLPGAEMVLVNRTDTFQGHRVRDQHLDELGRKVLAAKLWDAEPHPELVPLPREPGPRPFELSAATLERLVRVWPEGPRGGGCRISVVDGGLVLELLQPAGMSFDLLPRSETQLFVEGVASSIYLELDESDAASDRLIDRESLEKQGLEELAAGRADQALASFEKARRYYPDSASVWAGLARTRAARQESGLAIECYRRSLELDADNPGARRELERLESEREKQPQS